MVESAYAVMRTIYSICTLMSMGQWDVYRRLKGDQIKSINKKGRGITFTLLNNTGKFIQPCEAPDDGEMPYFSSGKLFWSSAAGVDVDSATVYQVANKDAGLCGVCGELWF